MTNKTAKRVADAWLRKKAEWAVYGSTHSKSVALMKWLAQATKKLGVGRHTYVVGGAVRNFIIDRPIKDIDVVIDSVRAGMNSLELANALAKLIPARTTVVMPERFQVAVLTVKGEWEVEGHDFQGEEIEIAIARKELYKDDDYKPYVVEPTTMEEDVYRREFTFNTLLWRLEDLANGPEKAEIIDLSGCGKRDLEQGLLTCPSDPDKTFSEDPIRMIRVLKFVGKYGFKVPKDVEAAVKRQAKRLKIVPWDQIAKTLFNSVLNEPTARKSLAHMKRLGLVDVIADMMQSKKNKGFATAMFNALKAKPREVGYLLDLLDLGLPIRQPLTFLDSKKDRDTLRRITMNMEREDADKLVAALVKPAVDKGRVFKTIDLPPNQRGKVQDQARVLILQNPALATNPRKLTDEVIKALR